jgi:predicted RNA-binding protein with PIN domain
MRYLIDGYNLLHAMGLLHSKAGPHGLEKARLALLGHLCGCHRTLGHGLETMPQRSVTVVFDASGAPLGAVPEDEYQGIHICYALEGEADDLIEDLIQRDSTPKQLTVVSDDRRIQQAARHRRCPVLGCLDYLDAMERLRQRQPPPEETPAKPEGMSEDETQHWLREFADLADDPKVRDVLGQDFRDKP